MAVCLGTKPPLKILANKLAQYWVRNGVGLVWITLLKVLHLHVFTTQCTFFFLSKQYVPAEQLQRFKILHENVLYYFFQRPRAYFYLHALTTCGAGLFIYSVIAFFSNSCPHLFNSLFEILRSVHYYMNKNILHVALAWATTSVYFSINNTFILNLILLHDLYQNLITGYLKIPPA